MELAYSEMTGPEIDESLRNDLYKAVYEEFVGPFDFDASEEIAVRPTERYAAGVLHPIGSEYVEIKDDDEEAPNASNDSPIEVGDVPESVPFTGNGFEEEYDEPISLSNARSQSAISMTIALRRGDDVSFEVRYATYEATVIDERKRYVRVPRKITIAPGTVEVPRSYGPPTKHSVDGAGLELWIVFRRSLDKADVVTVALCNTTKGAGSSARSYYQASLRVMSTLGLVPPTWDRATTRSESEEEASKRLIYRNVKNYAIGHGCATGWDNSDVVAWAETRVMPWADVSPMKVIHPSMRDSVLSIEQFGVDSRWPETLHAMRKLCDNYSAWIDATETRAASLPQEHTEAARANVALCRKCLERMLGGISVLESDETSRRAFIMMNKAMYDQYLHYSVVSGERHSLDEPPAYTRQWRPFQLAFILMNIAGIVDELCPDRDIVDLIWFPTGGGKTEAYLGLSAFALIHERLTGCQSDGVTVMMRYTLRLLTSQQFDRASSLICALESMRRRIPDVLGERSFRIGLWVGGSASPNTRQEADRSRRKYVDLKDGGNPFPVRCCPWCGADMEAERRKSYRRLGKEKRIAFLCPNHDCEYSTGDGLPLDVVDEEIYERPPSLLVGTIDKFALLPYRSQALALFGIRRGKHGRPPKLIIQDELHLISGPLGSMAAHYETLVSELCTREVEGASVRPKIVASTATVSRAKEQCDQLYACGKENVFQFPPSGIDYDDSFFSMQDNEGRGRRYVGIFVPDLSSATTSIRLYADLLFTPTTWEGVPDEWRDRYWTTIGYYNTTRELGQAVTWMGGDIPERLREHRRRARDAGKDYVRYINNGQELTGRKESDEVKANLDALAVSYPNRKVVDLCFATNMISVGLDVGRLGLMVVAGQPKSTAEYIQATSRVGRAEAKGVVFVLYSTTKPRDRSHYENFSMFHSSFYQNVEPSSVTAFCQQVRERALFGTLAGIYRSLTEDVVNDAYAYPEPEPFDTAAQVLCDRVGRVEPEELDGLKEDIEMIRDRWENGDFKRWDELNPKVPQPLTPVMHPQGGPESDQWSGFTFDVPTSMRDVDKECSVVIVGSYGDYGYSRGGSANA